METDLNKLRDRAYKIAKEHGFHEKEFSDEHWLMLIISEIGEAVNADRKGYHANLKEFEFYEKQNEDKRFSSGFNEKTFREDHECYIKDSVEDELADVAIRILDLSGLINVDLSNNRPSIFHYVVSEKKSLCENCYNIVMNITNYRGSIFGMLNDVIRQVIELAKFYSIDLFKFIDLKMKYNELRPYKNGKEY